MIPKRWNCFDDGGTRTGERDGWNIAEVIAKGDTVVHRLNRQVVNRARNVRLVDPGKPGVSRPVIRGRIALEIEAAEIYFRNVEIRALDDSRPGNH